MGAPRAQRWEEPPALISDAVLHQFAVIGTYDTIGRRLTERFAGVATDVVFSIAVQDEQDRETLSALARDIQAEPEYRARAAIVGTAA